MEIKLQIKDLKHWGMSVDGFASWRYVCFKKKGLREKTTSTNSRCAGVPTVDMEKVNILILDMNLVQ